MQVRSFIAACLLACACGTTDSTSTAGETDSSGIDTATEDPSTTGTSDTDTTDATTDDTGAPMLEQLCPGIDVSVVIDPDVTWDTQARDALKLHFDALAVTVGGPVRVLVNVGTEGSFYAEQGACLADLDQESGEHAITWGDNFKRAAGVGDALDCLLDQVPGAKSAGDRGDSMYSGLMFPILLEDGWPAEDSLAQAMLFARYDNENEGIQGMYNRPGMVTGAYTRLAGGGDRRRVAAMTYGNGASSLELLSTSFGPRGAHFESSDTKLRKSISEWTSTALQACEDADKTPEYEEPIGCERVDILFVVDGSKSMTDEQAALQGEGGNPPVLAEFTDALIAELGIVEDYHVGVVSTEPGVTRLHTHRDYPEYPESPETDCALSSGERWLIGPSDTLEQDFACIASTRSGTTETPLDNAANALQDPENAGFLRDDSLVIVVVVTDEDANNFEKTRLALRNQLVDAVGGD
ncbi:MAG: vWA domain-containing protein, partial [Nannocystaceae bacterium]